jgi:hypothetical protein
MFTADAELILDRGNVLVVRGIAGIERNLRHRVVSWAISICATPADHCRSRPAAARMPRAPSAHRSGGRSSAPQCRSEPAQPRCHCRPLPAAVCRRQRDQGRPCLIGQLWSRTEGNPAVRNLRGDDGKVGIIRSPVRAIVLPDFPSPDFPLVLGELLPGPLRGGCQGREPRLVRWREAPALTARRGPAHLPASTNEHPAPLSDARLHPL